MAMGYPFEELGHFATKPALKLAKSAKPVPMRPIVCQPPATCLLEASSSSSTTTRLAFPHSPPLSVSERLLQLGSLVSFEEAKELGMLDEVCDAEQLMDVAEARVCPPSPSHSYPDGS